MKPLNLTISAFGSYADLQTIDFTKLGTNGLYLITGETGSGKTTIFDAISFALFGKASGSGRDDYSMLRSDFAGEKAKTYVELDFVSGNSRYSIRRTIKKTGQDVTLLLPDGTTMSGDRNIKPKIAEVVGLDRDQFAQIVMIAQNDFLRFLQSGTDERLKILRRIFSTEVLKQFQERLKTLVKRENDKRVLILHDFERYGVDVYKRDEQFAEWEEAIKTDRAGLTEADKQLTDYDRRKQALAAELAIAEELCKKFDNLAKYRIALESHIAKSEETAKIKVRANRGEIALHRVKPLADEARKTALSHSDAQAELTGAKEKEVTAIAEMAAAAKFIEALSPLNKAQEDFAVLSREWESVTEKLKRIAALKINHAEIDGKRETLAKTRNDYVEVTEALAKLPPVTEYQTRLDNVTDELKVNEEKLIKLSALKSDFAIVAVKQADLRKVQNEFEILNNNFNESDMKYRVTEEAFLRNQAGILAAGLSDGVPCPVCGSIEHPAPAELSDNDATEAKLKKNREERSKAQADRESKASECSVLKTETDTLAKRVLSDFSGIAPGVSIESAALLLLEATEKTRSAIAVLFEKKITAEKTLTDLKTKSENMTHKRDELTPLIASLQSETDTLTKRFMSDFSEFVPNAEWEASEETLTDLFTRTQTASDELTARKASDKKKLDELTANWNYAAERKANAESAANAAKTLVIERASNEQKFLTFRTEAQSGFSAALRENGFAGEADYKDSLISEAELIELNKQLADYVRNGEQLNRDITRLESETANKKRPGIERLLAEQITLQTESKKLGEERDIFSNRLSKTDSALKELRRAAYDFDKVEKAYAAVKQLADTANGKLDFETYAQMAYFERVLRAANLRLKLMSQNRFTLLRKAESDDARKRSGLELEVLDAYTGKARPASGLSGGESFMASLSLALGLSDIVQQSAGGIHLDAMFIDEGFGSLDAEVLELAIRTLSEMAGTNRIIGIVSHVAELRERIDKQIQVEKTASGSRIAVMV